MFADIKEHCKDWDNKEEICAYLNKILDKEAFDGARPYIWYGSCCIH